MVFFVCVSLGYIGSVEKGGKARDRNPLGASVRIQASFRLVGQNLNRKRLEIFVPFDVTTHFNLYHRSTPIHD